MPVLVVEPWTDARWDAYVASHPRATVYHTSVWIRLVCEIGRYPSLCLVCERDGRPTGVLPLVAVESRLTGNRISTLPFSDTCFALADDEESARALVEEARALRARRGASFYEMRGAPALREGRDFDPSGIAHNTHFSNYVIPLAGDAEAVRKSFSKSAVRQTITKGARLGVSVRVGDLSDLNVFYGLYLRLRRRHGIPPQPYALFQRILEEMESNGSPSATLYLAEHERVAIAGLIVFRYGGVTYAKYEGADERRRDLVPLYPLLWKTIEDAVNAGDRFYDFGRTAADNPGLNEFKQRWGTTRVDLPYYFDPPREGVSVVRSDSLKYRLFTTAFRRMPASWSVLIGRRIFRHFG
ncbi:MAG TPA: GNAT family N-acetyltransferase [Candidatus Krumholzibacteria bacterium]|nr:GNAT family N-acetyltransferase [Candidatus Krumholzibacteria bacterium]